MPDLDVDLSLVLQVQDLAATLSAIVAEIERGRLRDIEPVRDIVRRLRGQLDRMGTDLTIRNFRQFVDHVVMPLSGALLEPESAPEPRSTWRRPSKGVRHQFTREQLIVAWEQSNRTRPGFATQLGITVESTVHHLRKHGLVIEFVNGGRGGPSLMRQRPL